MEDKPESFSSSHRVLNIVKNWRSLPLIVPHPGVFQGGSWNDSYRKGKNNIRSSTATAKAHFKIHCQRPSGPKGWVLVSKETSFERILIKFHLHNLDQASALRLHLNFKNLTERGFRISTKNNLHNLNQGSAAKYWLNLSFKPCAQCLDKKIALLPNFSFQICTKLSSTRFSESTSAIVTTSPSFE